jgi:mannitol-specific phosphotransferase system IIBC component
MITTQIGAISVKYTDQWESTIFDGFDGRDYNNIFIFFFKFLLLFFIFVLHGETLWHLQKFLQCIKYIIVQFTNHSPLSSFPQFLE